MGTRVATIADVGRIVSFLKRYHEQDSNLSDIAFDRQSMTQCIEYYIAEPRHVIFIYVTEHKELKGVLAASAEPFMFNKKRRWATDLLNVAEEGGAWLVKRFISWAKAQRVDRIIMGVSTGDERVDLLYEAVGLHRTGGMYMLNTKEEQE